MTEWIIAHPWMTFFLALTAIEAAAKIAGAVCQTVISCRKESQDIITTSERNTPSCP